MKTQMGKEESINWHAAFVQAMKAELYNYLDWLKFDDEYLLSSHPQRIDLLIVNKPPGIRIEKNIGRIFRGHNIIEYKSPENNLNVSDYMNVFAYAYRYAALENVSFAEITLSFVVTIHPRELIKYLTDERGLTITEKSHGIYEIHGEIWPVQIIESKKLTETDNLWLSALKPEISVATMERVLSNPEHSAIKMRAYMHALMQSNPNSMKEISRMSIAEYHKVLNELGLIDESVAEQRAAERERKAAERERKAAERERKANKERERRITAERMLERGICSEDIAFLLDIPMGQIDAFLADVNKSKLKSSE